MTRDRTLELFPVLKAWAAGQNIQVSVKPDVGDVKWTTYRSDEASAYPDFTNPYWQWRVEPKPREFWIGQISDGVFNRIYDKFPSEPTHGVLIHVREVFDR